MTCAALLAAMVPGLTLGDLDRHKVYEVPAAMVQTISTPALMLAKACAKRHGIHWKIVDARN